MVLTETKPYSERRKDLMGAMDAVGLEWRSSLDTKDAQRASGVMVVWWKGGGAGSVETDTAGRGVAVRLASDAGGSFLVVGIYGVSDPDRVGDPVRQMEASTLMRWAIRQVVNYREKRGSRARIIVMGDFNGVEDVVRDRGA